MKIIRNKNNSKNEITNTSCRVLRRGGLVVVPSDTVYGLSVDAQNKKAVDKLIAFKARPTGKPTSVFVADLDRAKECVTVNNQPHFVPTNRRDYEGAGQLAIIKRLTPGPFTFVLKSKRKVDQRLEAEDGTLGIRIVNFDFINTLVNAFEGPITATSANLSGRSSHYSTESLLKSLPAKKREMIDLVVDFGKLPRNKPSTVIDLTGDRLKTLRAGDIGVLDKRLKVRRFKSASEEKTKKIATTLLREHLQDAKKKPPTFLIEGELGVGKTVFVKGIGEFLGVRNIISPTFVIYYEYEVSRLGVKMLYHFDLYRVEEGEEFKYLGIDKMLKPENVICIEWGERSGEIISELKKSGEIVYVKMRYLSKNTRGLVVSSE